MNFLQLVNRTRSECGIPAEPLTTLQSTLSRESGRFVDWVGQSWLDLQTQRADWQWMRQTFTFPTVATTATYTAADAGVTDLGTWLRGPTAFRSYLTSAGVGGEQFMFDYLDYSDFLAANVIGTMRSTPGHPLEITVTPSGALQMWPVPDAIYTINGEYYRAPSALSADLDDPASAANGLPARFHLLIVAYAMERYAAFEGATEVDARAKTDIRRLGGQLQQWGMAPVFSGGALA